MESAFTYSPAFAIPWAKLTKQIFESLQCKNAPIQNRRQKVFNRGIYVFQGGLKRLCKGIERKNSVYAISYFNLGGLQLCVERISPPKPPAATGLPQYRVRKCVHEGKPRGTNRSRVNPITVQCKVGNCRYIYCMRELN